MNDQLKELIEAIPSEAFRDDPDGFLSLTPVERLRWLQHTAWFIWKHKGAASKWSAEQRRQKESKVGFKTPSL